MRLTYDPEADALYLKVSTAEIAETLEVAPNVMLDLDPSGHVVGVEMLGISLRPGAEPLKVDFELLVREDATIRQAVDSWREPTRAARAKTEAAE